MANAPPAISISGLVKCFPGVLAVDHLSFDVMPGEVFGLVGPDGAGKTTTLRVLAGVLSPDEGSSWVAGFDVARAPESAKLFISSGFAMDHLLGPVTLFSTRSPRGISERRRLRSVVATIGRNDDLRGCYANGECIPLSEVLGVIR